MTLLELLKEIFKPESQVTQNIPEKQKKETQKYKEDEEEVVAFSDVDDEAEFLM